MTWKQTRKCLVTDSTTAIVVHVLDHFLDLLFLWLKAQGTHGHLQLFGVNLTTAVCIEPMALKITIV